MVLARGIIFGNVVHCGILPSEMVLVTVWFVSLSERYTGFSVCVWIVIMGLFLLDTRYFPFCVGAVTSGPAPAPSFQ